MTSRNNHRRHTLKQLAALVAAIPLAGCDRLSRAPWFTRILEAAEPVNQAIQRIVSPQGSMAREYTTADLSPDFRSNGTNSPDDDDYRELAANGFADWTLEVDGLVDRPLSLSLAELRAMPSRTQITRHDCVEGWSAIGQWTGVPLAAVLAQAGLQREAKYLVFHCADPMEDTPDSNYYESIGLDDALHPQTILAYGLNGRDLPVANGAPLRLRVERQLGYKMAKYVMRIEAVASFTDIAGGRGGYWEDRGYEWYAGI
jgi:DMSO/TMAO reductase YedYZ molybdopterin-dependent catalytic subunit